MSKSHSKVKTETHIKHDDVRVNHLVSRGNSITTARGLLTSGDAIYPRDVSSAEAFKALIASGCVTAI